MSKSRPPFDIERVEALNPCPVSSKLILLFPSPDAFKFPLTVTPVFVVSNFLLLSKYSSVAPSWWQIIDCSPFFACIFTSSAPLPLMCKFPVALSRYECVPSWYSCKSCDAPNCSFWLSFGNWTVPSATPVIFKESTLLFALSIKLFSPPTTLPSISQVLVFVCNLTIAELVEVVFISSTVPLIFAPVEVVSNFLLLS